MENINIIISSLSGEKLKQNLSIQTKIIDIKSFIAQKKGQPIQAIQLKFNTKDLDDQKTIQECNIKNGDSIILMIKKILNQNLNVQNNKTQISQKNEEQFKELLDFGFQEKDIMEALNVTNNNYQEALIRLSTKNQQNIEEEIQLKAPTLKDKYLALLSEQIVSELRDKLSNQDEWNNTIENIGSQNFELSLLILQNQDQFRHLQQQHKIDNIINIDDEDLKTLVELREFSKNLDDKQILSIYLKNERDLYSTMEEIENLQK